MTSYGYDRAGRLTNLHTQTNAATVTRFQYSLNRAGPRTQVVETLPHALTLPATETSTSTSTATETATPEATATPSGLLAASSFDAGSGTILSDESGMGILAR